MAACGALPVEQALDGYTRAPVSTRRACASGFRADLTALADDPVDVPAPELPDVPVIHTVVDGDLYRR